MSQYRCFFKLSDLKSNWEGSGAVSRVWFREQCCHLVLFLWSGSSASSSFYQGFDKRQTVEYVEYKLHLRSSQIIPLFPFILLSAPPRTFHVGKDSSRLPASGFKWFFLWVHERDFPGRDEPQRMEVFSPTHNLITGEKHDWWSQTLLTYKNTQKALKYTRTEQFPESALHSKMCFHHVTCVFFFTTHIPHLALFMSSNTCEGTLIQWHELWSKLKRWILSMFCLSWSYFFNTSWSTSGSNVP